ncbi:MAG: hypothetical protein D6718_10905 [Acidobacteria bacterium]|nr:MAG: hypothetical protein D6718_10905 [Acidobacteriota bacterium]
MRHRIFAGTVALALTVGPAAFATVPPPSGSFDTPLTEFYRLAGGEVHVAVSGVGTQEGDHVFEINVPGEPLAAWLYWAGSTRETGAVDPAVTLSGGALVQPEDLYGYEVGRRYTVFADETNTAGEVVMKADVPVYAFQQGVNVFVISNFNERDPTTLLRIYRQQYGVAMVVAYQVPAGVGDREVIALEGADISNYDRYYRMPGYQDQTHSEVICFDFQPLACDQVGILSIAAGGVMEDVHPVPGTTRIAYGSPEQTWFTTTSTTPPASLLGTTQLLEANKFTNSQFGFRGMQIGIFSANVPLTQGSTHACFQHEMLPKMRTNEFAQNFVTFAATLEYDRACGTGTPTTGTCELAMDMSVDPLEVPAPPVVDCDGPLQEVRVEYTGQGCIASEHQQAFDAKCSGNAQFREPVTVELYQKNGALIGTRSNVMLGDLLTFNAAEAGLDRLGKVEWRVIDPDTGELLETVEAKTECDDELVLGDQFGSFLLVGFTSMSGTTSTLETTTTLTYTVTNNGTADSGEVVVTDDLFGEVGRISNLAPGEQAVLTHTATTWKTQTYDAVADGSADCQATGTVTQTFLPPPVVPDEDDALEGQFCEDGLEDITVAYTGEPCTTMTQDQNGKVVCEGDALFTDGVQITVLDKKGRVILEQPNVMIGDQVTVHYYDVPPKPESANKPEKRKREKKHKKRLPGDLVFRVSIAATGEVLGEVRIHTSCSEPLSPGDRFGPVDVVSFTSHR